MPPHQTAQLVEITDVFQDPGVFDKTRDDLWIFGYGSLMWLPEFDYRLAVAARVQGWHRQFTCLSLKAWGTAGAPGLSAALLPGGSVLGVAFAVAPKDRAATLKNLAIREAAYGKVTARINPGGGIKLQGLTFVARPGEPRFLDAPDEARQIRYIRQGRGPRGTSLHYLESTVACLDQLGSGPTKAHELLLKVRASRP